VTIAQQGKRPTARIHALLQRVLLSCWDMGRRFGSLIHHHRFRSQASRSAFFLPEAPALARLPGVVRCLAARRRALFPTLLPRSASLFSIQPVAGLCTDLAKSMTCTRRFAVNPGDQAEVEPDSAVQAPEQPGLIVPGPGHLVVLQPDQAQRAGLLAGEQHPHHGRGQQDQAQQLVDRGRVQAIAPSPCRWPPAPRRAGAASGRRATRP